MKILLSAFALLLLMPFFAQAQEGGSVILKLDGESYEFPLWAEQSDWGGAQSNISASIYTRPADKEVRALFRGFTIGFTLWGGNSAESPDIGLRRMVDGEVQQLFGNADTGAAITVDETLVEGKFLTMTGSFVSDMGPSPNYGRDVDLSDPVIISGTFSVTLGPVQ